MLTTSARLFRLLARLQMPGSHTGTALAAQLEVSPRTVRNDIAALRELGYPIHAVPGVAGGYRLGSGSRLPPLLLDDEEAIAVTLGLTAAAAHTATDTAEASVRALSKIIAMLPARLRPRLATLARATATPPIHTAPVPSDTLQAIAAAIQAREQLRFGYQAVSGTESYREVEPYRLVLRAGRWYLLAWDCARDDWRTFRVDRIVVRTPNGRRFNARPAPPGGFEKFVVKHLESAAWQQRYRVRLGAPADVIRARAPLAVDVTPDGRNACIVTVGADSPAWVARYLSWWNAPFEVLDSAELLAEVRVLAERYTDAATHSGC